jgi:phosphoesterase RecJ-like protein
MIHDVLQALRQRTHHILITTHWNPDGDAVGSALGWAHYLRASGHQVRVVLPNAPSKPIQSSPGYTAAYVTVAEERPDEAAELFRRAELHFALDYNTSSRVGSALEPFVREFAGRQVLVDHHQQPDPLFTEAFSSTAKGSTSEMIADLITADDGWGKVDVACAENLLMGMITDSGSFRFPSTTAHTMATAARLIEAGAHAHAIHARLYDANPLSRLHTFGHGLRSAVLVAGGRGAVLVLSLADLESAGYVAGDSEGLVNWGLSVDGVEVSVLLREDAAGLVKMSFRSTGDRDVNEFARSYYSGGGHRNAAGGASSLGLADLKAELIQYLEQWLA